MGPIWCERSLRVTRFSARPPALALTLADALRWPVLADHRSRCRAPGTIVHFDGLLRTPAFVDSLGPEVVLDFGEPLASKLLSQ